MEAADISGLHINDNEYCTVVGSQYYKNNKFKVKISKLTPFTLSNSRESFNPNILVNDPKVKPSVGRSVTTQNYVTIERSAMCNLIGLTDNNYNVPDGTVLKCRCQNGDYNTMVIVDGKF